MSFQQVQCTFAAHMRDPEGSPAPYDIEERRLEIYRNLLYNNIESFIASGFPVLRSLLNDADWHRIVRDFIRRHQAQTPYFLEISREFLSYLQEECELLPADLPFALELAHYEWVELALDVSPLRLPPAPAGEVDIMAGHPLVSPLAWRLSYQYPVHQIGPTQRAPAPQPTYLVVYRNRADQVRFLEANAATFMLLQLLNDDSQMTSENALRQIARELGVSDVESIFSFGNQMVKKLLGLDVLLGVEAV